MGRTYLPGLTSVGFQVITLSNSTAIGINSTIRNGGASHLVFSIETNDARFRQDGTVPTLTTGVLIPKDTLYTFDSYDGTTHLMFQRSTGTCKISVQAYKYIGSGSRT